MSWLFGSSKTTMVAPADAMPGRDHYPYEVPKTHAVLGTPLAGPWTPTTEVLYVGMGCFWGAERTFWQRQGVVCTAAGYQGGFTPFPTYEETCTARTGHTEAVMVAYEPDQISTYEILKTFWENHDPTTQYRQGNDIGTQYRSVIFTHDEEQQKIAEMLIADLAAQHIWPDPIVTAVSPAPTFWRAEDYHQNYYANNPLQGYCQAVVAPKAAKLRKAFANRLKGA